MRRTPTILICLLAAVLTAGAVWAKPYKVAILEFDPVTEEAVKENLGRQVSEFLTTAAVNSGAFSVVERAALKKVLDEMQFGQGSQAPGTVAQAIGAMVGAQGVLTGSVVKSGGSVRLDARLIDVGSGNIVAARSAYAKSDLRSVSTAAELLVGQLEGDLAKLAPKEPAESAKSRENPKPQETPKPQEIPKPQAESPPQAQ